LLVRHVHAALHLQAGMPVRVVTELLGHASIQITLEIYPHVLPSRDAEAVEAVTVLLDAAERSDA
jgi:integrase